MYWTDIVFDRVIPEADIRRAWATTFGVPAEAIGITPDFADFNPWVDSRVRVVAERYIDRDGDFPMLLSMVVRGNDLEEKIQTDETTLDAIQRFCTELGCRALTSVADEDPSTWVLITPTERWRVLGYDPDELGDKLEDAIFEPLKVAVA